MAYSDIRPVSLNAQLDTANDEINHYKAMLCATLSNIRKAVDDIDSFLDILSGIEEESGLNDEDLQQFWQMHLQEDRIRIGMVLKETFSAQEILRLKDLIKEGLI